MPPATELLAYLGGFAAAEGHFARAGNHFAFRVAVAVVDREMCILYRDALGAGRVYGVARRVERHQDVAVYAVQALPDLVSVVVPFMDEFLPPSHKRQQYEVWRAQLLTYWNTAARRVRDCTADDCTEPRRAKGLCRHHYFERYRR